MISKKGYSEYSLKLETITKVVHSTCVDLFEKDNIIEPKRYLFNNILNNTNNLNTLSYLLMEAKDRRHFATSIVLILRNLLTQNIQCIHLMAKADEDDEKFLNNIEVVNYDHVQRLESNYKSFLGHHYYRHKHKKIHEEIRRLNEKYKKPDTKISPKEFTTIKAIKDLLEMHKNDEGFYNIIGRMADSWILFSKYEHAGEFSFKLTMRAFKDEEIPKLFESYIHAIDFNLVVLIANLGSFPTDIINDQFISELTKLRLELQEIGIKYIEESEKK